MACKIRTTKRRVVRRCNLGIFANSSSIEYVMQRIMFKSKLHRARVTQAELYYEGSLTIDQGLMDAADLVAYEKVAVVNINNGARFETYVIPGSRGSRIIGLNGAAARLGAVGDEIIIISYTSLSDEEARRHHPTVVLVDQDNEVVSTTFDVLATQSASPVPTHE